jgi:hypothetical protein
VAEYSLLLLRLKDAGELSISSLPLIYLHQLLHCLLSSKDRGLRVPDPHLTAPCFCRSLRHFSFPPHLQVTQNYFLLTVSCLLNFRVSLLLLNEGFVGHLNRCKFESHIVLSFLMSHLFSLASYFFHDIEVCYMLQTFRLRKASSKVGETWSLGTKERVTDDFSLTWKGWCLSALRFSIYPYSHCFIHA